MLECPTCGSVNEANQLTCGVCGALMRPPPVAGRTVQLGPAHAGRGLPGAPHLPRALEPDLKRTVIGVAPDPNFPLGLGPLDEADAPIAASEAPKTLQGVPFESPPAVAPERPPEGGAAQRAAQTMIGVAPAPGGAFPGAPSPVGPSHAPFVSPYPVAPVEVEVPGSGPETQDVVGPRPHPIRPAAGIPATRTAAPAATDSPLRGAMPAEPPLAATLDAEARALSPIERTAAPLDTVTPRTVGAADFAHPPPVDRKSSQRTKIGVAAPAPHAAPVPLRKTPSEVPTLISAGPDEKRRGRTAPRRALTTIAILGALLGLSAVVGVAAWHAMAQGPVRARAELDEQGRPRLTLECEECSDGTLARVANTTAVFSAHRATLAPVVPLALGDNELGVELLDTTGRTERVALTVPLEFRLQGDLSGLTEQPPVIRVQVEALAGTLVSVNGTSLPLDGGGRASLAVDVSRALTGPSPVAVKLTHEIPYTVTRQGRAGQTGQLRFPLHITPLMVDSPGESIFVDQPNFTLAGRTAPGGSVTIGGRPITVDGSGRFAQLMNVSSNGETTITVRAVTPKLAPRLFPIRVRRVASLVEEARRLDPLARGWPVLSANPAAAKGASVVLEGSVVEVHPGPYTTALVLEVTRDCVAKPCHVWLSYASRFETAPGEKLVVYGKGAGLADGPRPGERIPSVRVDFFLRPDQR